MKALLVPLTERPLRLLAFTLIVALAGSLALTAEAAPPPDVMGGPLMMMAAPHRMGRMLDAVSATEDQRSQIKAIMDAARADLQVIQQSAEPLRQQLTQLFTQPTVDANAAEALRQQMAAQHEQASKRMLLAMVDMSRVLTLEQRRQIADKMAQHRTAMDRYHHAAPMAPAAR